VPVAGVHGLERRGADGRIQRAEPGAGLAAARSVLRAFADEHPALLLEDKGLSLGLHYRAAPELGAASRRLAERLTQAHDLALQPGDMVAELRTPGPTKGDALAAFMAEPPFAGAAPVFVGDDLTDEDGFTAARALGGTGILVGPARATAADSRLADVGAVFAWIEASMTGSMTA
jgi:trehalose 6-phosphate phosphatase